MKVFKPLEKLYISKNVNSKTLEEMAEYLKCGQKEIKNCYETMKLNGEYDKYRVSNYETVKKEEDALSKQGQKSLLDLNDYLFERLETLNNENLNDEQLKKEVEKTKAIVSVSQTIVNNAKILLDATKYYQNNDAKETSVLLGQ